MVKREKKKNKKQKKKKKKKKLQNGNMTHTFAFNRDGISIYLHIR